MSDVDLPPLPPPVITAVLTPACIEVHRICGRLYRARVRSMGLITWRSLPTRWAWSHDRAVERAQRWVDGELARSRADETCIEYTPPAAADG